MFLVFNAYPKFIGLALILTLFSCRKADTKALSFYHWETVFDLDTEEQSFLEEEKVTRLYIKFFDLVVLPNAEIGPVATVQFNDIPEQDIIPVVYITTPVFEVIDSSEVKQLAELTYEKIKSLYPVKAEFKEIQIDCDWMASIKDRYFYFLECLKMQDRSIEVSTTIRLYQYKYPNLAGVPPVDKGVLMYYNMGKLTDYNEPNSILNNTIGEQYLGFGTYPLPLDFALPRFSWTLQFRYGKFIQIIPNLGKVDFENKSLFELNTEGYYSLKEDTLIGGRFLRQGDEFRHEACEEIDLINAVELLKAEKNQPFTQLIFYDLNPNVIHEKDKLNSVFTRF